MDDRTDERLARLEAKLDRLGEQMVAGFEPIREGQSDLKAEIAELRGEVRGELRQLDQRMSDVNARLPVPIAYQPPDKRTA